jgi:hypothetical protein
MRFGPNRKKFRAKSQERGFMRTVHWLFLVSVGLFICGVAFVVAGARAGRAAAPVEAPPTMPLATVKQIMNGITGPSATAVYNAVSTVVNAEGIKEVAPETDEDWAALGNQAAALVESGNLLLLEGRALDTGDWVTMTKAFMNEAQKALKAAEAKDKEAIFEASATINETCDNCHAKYQRQ